ncbi:MAG: universal stress protein [candidate division KSB1 bacterium]|nr:universal stress protein [candidate division KSB1 bacterium]MDZ7300860.1 universal stress protein [candidate division KSB1 bacterium]MDZ7309870.1 universal stress protein [candidate division KSB1 bacterium]
MIRLNKILVPTDFSTCADQALAHAIILGNAMKSEVTLLHVVTLFDESVNHSSRHFSDLAKFYQEVEQTVSSQMRGLSAQHPSLTVRQEVVRGYSPAEEIVRFAEEKNDDLIVMGTHGRTGLGHLLLGSVAERVVRSAKCPVLTVRKMHADIMRRSGYQRILVPLDFSQYSKHALRYGVELAKQFNSQLDILHVIEEQVQPAYYVSGEISLFNLVPDIREKSRAALKEFVEGDMPANLDFLLHLREGRSHTEIVAFAEEQETDVIVLATHGLSGLEHLLLGSTAEKVIRKAKCAVLTVKSPEREFVVPGTQLQ